MTRIQEIAGRMREKTTEELTTIWIKNDRKEWSDDAFQAVRTILTERGVSLPDQQTPLPVQTDTKASAKLKPRLPFFAGVARWVSLILATLGVLGWSRAASEPRAGGNMMPWIIVLVVGVLTVNSLRRPFLRIPAGVLNALLVLLGVWFFVVTPEGTLPEMRRIVGGFCVVAGSLNLVGLRSAHREKITT